MSLQKRLLIMEHSKMLAPIHETRGVKKTPLFYLCSWYLQSFGGGDLADSYMIHYSLSLSLSLTHTHTHTLSLTHTHTHAKQLQQQPN